MLTHWYWEAKKNVWDFPLHLRQSSANCESETIFPVICEEKINKVICIPCMSQISAINHIDQIK